MYTIVQYWYNEKKKYTFVLEDAFRAQAFYKPSTLHHLSIERNSNFSTKCIHQISLGIHNDILKAPQWSMHHSI